MTPASGVKSAHVPSSSVQSSPFDAAVIKEYDNRVRSEQSLASTRHSPRAGLIRATFGRGFERARRAVVFTSDVPGAGVTWMACAVAADLAAANRTVLLTDALVLTSMAPAEDVVALCKQLPGGKTWMLGARQAAHASCPRNAGNHQPKLLLATLLDRFDHILIDAPALAQSRVALELAPDVTSSLLIAREGLSTRRGLLGAARALQSAGGTVLGYLYLSQ